jgi:hypothetical protein
VQQGVTSSATGRLRQHSLISRLTSTSNGTSSLCRYATAALVTTALNSCIALLPTNVSLMCAPLSLQFSLDQHLEPTHTAS